MQFLLEQKTYLKEILWKTLTKGMQVFLNQRKSSFKKKCFEDKKHFNPFTLIRAYLNNLLLINNQRKIK